MEENIPLIEKMPFFVTFHSKNKAIIDIKAFEKWIYDAEFLSWENERDRKQAFEELERGEALDLSEVMKEWQIKSEIIINPGSIPAESNH